MPNMIVKILLQLIDKASRPARKTEDGLNKIAKAGKRASKSFDIAANLNHAAAGLDQLANQAKRAIIAPVVDFADYEKAIAEVSTLVDSAVFSNEELVAITEKAALTFGGKAEPQAKALYQTISAGASDAASATAVLDAANRLAIGGVTDVTTAVDGLTTVLNAYGLEMVKDAIPASDSFFVAVKEGKTTVGELASSIGKVAPLAAALGLSLDETNAALATLTTQGINTKFAASGLKAAFSNILQPTEQAAKLADELGIEFDATALKAKGFKGFLDQITATSGLTSDELQKLSKQSQGSAIAFKSLVEQSGGNIKSMSTFFSSIEGVNAMLALTANGGEKFAGILEKMANKTGATETATAKMQATQAQAFEDMKANLDKTMRTLGKGFVPAVNEALESVLEITKAITEFAEEHPGVIKNVGGLLIKLIAFATVMRSTMLVMGLFTSAKGLGGMVGALTRVAAGAETTGEALVKLRTTGINRTAKGLAGAGGLIALAGMVGFAFGTWLDKSLGLSDALAGVNLEVDKFNRNAPAFLGNIPVEDMKELKEAEEALAIAEEKRRKGLEGFKGLLLGEFAFDLLSDEADEIARAKATIDRINREGRKLGAVRGREAEAGEMEGRKEAGLEKTITGPGKAKSTAVQEAFVARFAEHAAGITIKEPKPAKSEIDIKTRVQDERTIQEVRTSGDIGESRSIDTGVVGIGT